MPKENKKAYDERVSFQRDNKETKGDAENQNQNYNIKKEALGPNTRRSK